MIHKLKEYLIFIIINCVYTINIQNQRKENTMNETPIYEVTTTMEKDDYRNFLFLTTFQTADAVVSLVIIALILGVITSMITGFSLSSLFFSTLFFFLVLFALTYSKLEKNVKAIYPLDQPAAVETEQTIVFYDTYLTSTNRTNADITTAAYNSIYKVKEDDSYIILMLTKELASVICKKDLDKETIAKISNLLKEKCRA